MSGPARQPSVGLSEIEAAAERLAGRVRRTPVIRAAPVLEEITAGDLYLKLECLQVSGSFKIRGATNTLLSLGEAELARGLITASGGNHGLGVAAAAREAGVPAVIYLPTSTPPAKAEKLRAWGAEVIVEGAVWDDANGRALEAASRRGLTYVHPFAQPTVIAGQGTLGLEILEQVPDVDILLVSIGGGGLISGIATAVKARRPSVQVIGIEPTGAPTLYESLKAGRLVELPAIRTAANTLAPRRSEEINLNIISAFVDDIRLVEDDDMRRAARWLWFELGIAAELSAAAALAALMTGAVKAAAGRTVVALICGAGSDGLQ